MAGIQTNHVPYRGSAPMMTDLIGGRIEYAFDGVVDVAGLHPRRHDPRCWASPTRKRSPVLPDEPTISESALPGFDTTVWFGLFAPAGTPKAVVELVNSKVNAVLAPPEVKESFLKLGDRAGRRRPGSSGREGADGNAEMGEDRARQEYSYRAIIGRTPTMSATKRQMHLGVFVLGTGNHSAGWRYEGAYREQLQLAGDAVHRRASPSAASSTCSSSPTRLAMDPGDHPSFV